MTEDENVVVLTDEDGNDHEFEVLDIMEIDECEYAILLPLFENEAEEAIILKMGLDEDGDEVLFDIEDDDEWEMVAEAWQKSVIGNNGEAQ